MNRRNFIKNLSVLGVGVAVAPKILADITVDSIVVKPVESFAGEIGTWGGVRFCSAGNQSGKTVSTYNDLLELVGKGFKPVRLERI